MNGGPTSRLGGRRSIRRWAVLGARLHALQRVNVAESEKKRRWAVEIARRSARGGREVARARKGTGAGNRALARGKEERRARNHLASGRGKEQREASGLLSPSPASPLACLLLPQPRLLPASCCLIASPEIRRRGRRTPSRQSRHRGHSCCVPLLHCRSSHAGVSTAGTAPAPSLQVLHRSLPSSLAM